jgi:hypothetical protein
MLDLDGVLAKARKLPLRRHNHQENLAGEAVHGGPSRMPISPFNAAKDHAIWTFLESRQWVSDPIYCPWCI